MMSICREYIVGLSMEIAGKELPKVMCVWSSVTIMYAYSTESAMSLSVAEIMSSLTLYNKFISIIHVQ